MPTVFEPNIEEYVGFDEWIQGNVNVAGLIYEHAIEDGFGTEDRLYSRMPQLLAGIEETLDISEDFTPSHEPWTALTDGFGFIEDLGHIPINVFQSNVNVVYDKQAAPVNVWFVGLNVVQGPDVFYDHLYDSVGIDVTYCQGVPYFWPWVYETIHMEFDWAPPTHGGHIGVFFYPDDFVNMRHFFDPPPEWMFISQCMESFFVYDNYIWGWYHEVNQSLGLEDWLRYIVDRIIDEHMTFREGLTPKHKAHHSVQDTVFSWDTATDIRGWTLNIDEDLTFEEAARVYLELVVQDRLMAEEMARGEGDFSMLAKDQMHMAEKMMNSFHMQLEDSFGVEDEGLRRWLGMALVEDQASVSMEATPNQYHDVQIELTISLEDTDS